MGKKFLTWWESRLPRHQILIGSMVFIPLIFAVHEAFFPRLQWYDSALYALIEGVPLALIVCFATQSEISRRS